MKITSRSAAKALGVITYFTGKACRNGHVADRFVSNGTCCVCTAASNAHRRAEAPERFIEYGRRHRERNADRIKDAKRRRRIAADSGLEDRQITREKDRQSRKDAIRAGADRYASASPCKHGHVGWRFTKSYACGVCWELSLHPKDSEKIEAASKRRQQAAERGIARRAIEAVRSDAISAGRTTYVGAPCKFGHGGLRWTASYACVECSKTEEKKHARRKYEVRYRECNRARIVEQARSWSAKNPDKRKAIVKSYDARRRQQVSGGDSTSDVFEWERAAKKVCYWCGVKCADDYHVDHYHPLSKGGRHVIKNLVIACPSCNLRKNAKDPYEFAASIGRLF